MSVGTAILLSAILVAVVLLYGFTKDRWRWARFVKRAALLVLGGIALIGLAAAVLVYWNNVPQPPITLTSLWGVTLGEKERDVIFRKGQPKQICSHSNNIRSLWYQTSTYGEGSWSQIVLDPKLGVIAIVYFGDLSGSGQEQGAKILDGQSSSSVIGQWGDPDRIVDGANLTLRSYYWDRYNLIVAFEKDSADVLIVRNVSASANDLARKSEMNCVNQPS